MKDIKLSIELLPKGAWGNDLSKTLPKKEWDKLREFCYNRFNNECVICGRKDEKLHAHEVWTFDNENKTQTLVDIIALCPKCHGVKHFRNSERLGYGDNAKKHFMKINNCSELDFANHYLEAQLKFEESNEIYRWNIVANLDNLGGKGVKVPKRILPLIDNPYKEKVFNGIDSEDDYEYVEIKPLEKNGLYPKIRYIEVDNYLGNIAFVTDFTNKIEMWNNNERLSLQYNFAGKFVARFSVENITFEDIYFKLYNNNGIAITKKFKLNQVI